MITKKLVAVLPYLLQEFGIQKIIPITAHLYWQQKWKQ
ncbi:hypothetical protein B4168_1029 [Anoxybacillus flavithermus]|nr:hypothetical protein B4168_1029 [Anoxybacillus flavithermus]OAO87035.1 hypothetical protein GT23_2053 [Parageobacillus thermoglucosidasius]